MKKTNRSLFFAGLILLPVLITGIFSACSDSFDPDVSGITFDKTSLYIGKGGDSTLKATVHPETAAPEKKRVTWHSDNPDVTIEVAAGTILGPDEYTGGSSPKAVSAGTVKINVAPGATAGDTATVTATIGGFTATCIVMVEEPVAVNKIILSSTTLTISKGETKNLTAAISPSYATNKNVTWKSDEPKVTIQVQEGNNWITLNSDQQTGGSDEKTVPAGTVRITVLSSAIPEEEITITATSADGAATEDCTVTVGSGSTPGVEYTVTFDKNGGDTDANPKTKTVTTSGAKVGTLPATKPTRVGYTFDGWAYQASGNKPTGTDAVFDENSPVSKDMTVYAQWKVDWDAFNNKSEPTKVELDNLIKNENIKTWITSDDLSKSHPQDKDQGEGTNGQTNLYFVYTKLGTDGKLSVQTPENWKWNGTHYSAPTEFEVDDTDIKLVTLSYLRTIGTEDLETTFTLLLVPVAEYDIKFVGGATGTITIMNPGPGQASNTYSDSDMYITMVTGPGNNNPGPNTNGKIIYTGDIEIAIEDGEEDPVTPIDNFPVTSQLYTVTVSPKNSPPTPTVITPEDLDITAPEATRIPETTVSGTGYTGTIEWNPADDPFDTGIEYTATVTLTAEPGFTFDGVDQDSFTNTPGGDVTHDAGDSSGTLEITIEFSST